MKKAFTLLELVFVIVVIGILAALIIPSTRATPVAEASIQLTNHLNYAKHLAIMDDKFDSNNGSWFRNLWQVAFNGNQYSIISNNNTLLAEDPLTQTNIQNIDLNNDYQVTVSFDATSGCAAETDISFDHFGRPIIGDLNVVGLIAVQHLTYLTSQCRIILTNGTETETIAIEPETGYTRRL